MHQSIPPAPSHPPPSPRLLRAICRPCQSRGCGICKFFTAQGRGICQPRGHSLSNTHAVSHQNVTTQRVLLGKKAYWLICQGQEKIEEGCKGMFTILCMFFFIAYQAKIITQRNWSYHKQVTRPELLWGKGVRDEVLQIWTAGHFSLHIGVTVRKLKGER